MWVNISWTGFELLHSTHFTIFRIIVVTVLLFVAFSITEQILFQSLFFSFQVMDCFSISFHICVTSVSLISGSDGHTLNIQLLLSSGWNWTLVR
jgi:hypothetical protein